MAGYDGSIRINTQLNTQNASAQLMSLENRIIKTADKIASLRAKMDSLRDAKIPTQEYKTIESDIAKAEQELNKLVEKQAQMQNEGKDSGTAWENLNRRIQATNDYIEQAKSELQDLVNSGKAFSLGKDSQEYANYEQQLGYLENDYEVLQQRQREILERNRETRSSFKRLADVAKNALKKIIGSFNNMNKSTKSTNASLKSALKAILKYGLGIRSVYVLINKFRNAVKEGFANLAQFSVPVNESLSMLKSSLTQLKNSLATAFAPILTAIVPMLKMLIDMVSQAATYVGMFIATLTGASSFTKAIAVQEDYAASLDKTGSAAKKAAGALAKFDDLDVWNKPSSGGGGAGAGQVPVTDMFEEVPIDTKIVSLADKFKEVMSSLFAPFKEAWFRDGESVMDSWKYALQETQNLMKDIGRDFLTMWSEEATITMLSDILHIWSDIELVIGNLAKGLREAWNTNDIGLKILENIRDIFATIIEHIRNAADYTVTWSENLDFYPLLESVNGLLEALQPLADNIGLGLEWFYTNVLLPIAAWTIEDAIPAFLDMLSAGLDALNAVLDVFKPLGTWLWENFLQPLGEWTGEMIVSAMKTITDLLTKLGDWISEHSEAIQKFISIAAPIAGIVLAIANAGTILSAAIGILSGVLAALTSPVTLVIAGIAALAAGFVYLYEQSEEFKAFVDGLGGRIKALWEENLKPIFENLFEMFGLLGEAITVFWQEILQPILSWAMEVLAPTIADVCDIVFSQVENVIKLITAYINGIINVVKGVINILLGIATGDWQRVWDGFAGVVEGVAGIIKGIINAIIGAIEAMANGVVAGINTVIRALNGLSFDLPTWLPGDLGGKSLSLNIGEIPKVNIPRLATGAVIRGGNPFMAILGDQPAGKVNIEAPADLIKEMARQGIREELSNVDFGRSTNQVISLNINGEEFARLTLGDFLQEMGRKGYDVQVLGVN